MRIKFIDNIGSNDAEKHGLDFRLCLKDATCEVSADIGRRAVASGLAVEAPSPPKPASPVAMAKPPEIKATPAPPVSPLPPRDDAKAEMERKAEPKPSEAKPKATPLADRLKPTNKPSSTKDN